MAVRLSRHWYVALVLVSLIGFGIGRVIATYHVLSQTWDEPAHIAAGMEWLSDGVYRYEPKHPPLARVMVALGPFLDGLRSIGAFNVYDEGNAILHARGTYWRNLTLARLGTLPFFVLASLVVWMWGRRIFGEAAALFATALFTTLPPILAHAGVAATDLALAATFVSAMFATAIWLDAPTRWHSVLLGFAMALSILSRLPALMYLGVCGLIVLGLWLRADSRNTVRSLLRRWPRLIVVGLTVFMTLWAGYRFSFRPLSAVEDRPHRVIDRWVGSNEKLRAWAYAIVEAPVVPAGELLEGVVAVVRHNAQGHPAYLFGQVSFKGWWYFFPVALAVKTPLPFLILAGVGVVALARRPRSFERWEAWVPALCALGVLLASLPSHIDSGVRIMLPMYPLLAIVAGLGGMSLWRLDRFSLVGRILVAGLITWQVVGSVLVHPDYLAYFNELAGSQPERILINSDLDWGQDLERLRITLHQLRVERVSIAYNGWADLPKHDLPPFVTLVPHQPTTGWIAISIWLLENDDTGLPPYDGFAWLKAYQPVTVVGRTIKLYYIPETSMVPADSSAPSVHGGQ